MSRWLGWLGILALSGCVSSESEWPSAVPRSSDATSGSDDVAISVSRDTEASRPTLIVTITNRSERTLCISADTIRDPYSQEMDLMLRDRMGRDVRRYRSGFLPPPSGALVRLEPGDHVRGSYYLDSRFRLRGGWPAATPGMTIQANFRYGYCDDATSRWARSDWQPI